MKTFFKLVIALLLLNAVARGAWATWNYYQLRDATQELLTFSPKATSDELHNAILIKAQQLNLPLKPEDVDVRRDGLRTVAEASYTQAVEFVPSYFYPIKFSFLVDALSLSGVSPKNK